jgi:hypothetical protein
MRAVDFLLETVSHFARRVQGPPPGVPFHADAEFETSLVSICQHQMLSALVSESFDELALPPTISRITIARIKHHAGVSDEIRQRRLQLAGRIAAVFSERGIRAALLGDVWIASGPEPLGRLRPVGRIDVMIDETRWMDAVAVLRDLGFFRSRIQPRIADSADALRYHQYYSPLMMHNHDGDTVEVRFRVIDFGNPGRENQAWSRVAQSEVAGTKTAIVSVEDQLIHSVISFGAEGFVDLLPVLDAGWLLNRHIATLDWKYLTRRLYDRGLYSAFYFTLELVCELLRIQMTIPQLDPPAEWRRRLFHVWWRPREASYTGETEPTAGRFVWGLVESGGFASRMLWLHRAVFPRRSWVRSVYGRPANLWLCLKFLHDVRSGRRRRAANLEDQQGDVTDFNRSH